MDDRDDHLQWLWVREPDRRHWIDIVVVDASVGAVPRRKPRRIMHWSNFFAKLRADDLKRTKELEKRLRQVRSRIPYREPSWVPSPPARGFLVKLNGDELGRVAVSDPGSLSIDVVVRRRPEKHAAYLNVHGGDRVGQRAWRWRKWPWDLRRLEVGDRVRIEVVSPVRLSRSRVGRLETSEVTEMADIIRELMKLRKRLTSDYYRKEPAAMLQAERERLPARRYARG